VPLLGPSFPSGHVIIACGIAWLVAPYAGRRFRWTLAGACDAQLETVLGAVVSIKGQVGEGILYGSPIADSFRHSGLISIRVALTAL
jgi:hypothetical protein